MKKVNQPRTSNRQAGLPAPRTMEPDPKIVNSGRKPTRKKTVEPNSPELSLPETNGKESTIKSPCTIVDKEGIIDNDYPYHADDPDPISPNATEEEITEHMKELREYSKETYDALVRNDVHGE